MASEFSFRCRKCGARFVWDPVKGKGKAKGKGKPDDEIGRCPSCGHCNHCNRQTCFCPYGNAFFLLKRQPLAEAIFALTDRLFLLDGKDITFQLADGGKVEAHSVVLMASSDVFKQMLQSQMSEATSRTINLPDVTAVTLRVFLRLLYTGQADASDWAELSEETAPPHSIQRPAKGIGKGKKGKKGKGKDSSSDDDSRESSSESSEGDVQDLLPLDILLNVAVLVKKYMVEHLVELTTHTLIKRMKVALHRDVEVWNDAMAKVILNDIAPVRTASLEKAKTNSTVRTKFHRKELHPAVQYELSAFFGAPAVSPRPKRGRLA